MTARRGFDRLFVVSLGGFAFAYLLLIGAIVGLGPSLVISIVGLVAPQIVVPGAQFLPLGVGLLPVMFALAAVRGERSAQTA